MADQVPEEPITLQDADRPSRPQFVLGLDLDGVCADYYGAIRPIAAEWLGCALDELTPDVTYGFPEWDLDQMGGYLPLHRWAVTEHHIFENAPPINGAPAAIRRLDQQEDLRIRIITNRLYVARSHQVAAQQTVQWLDRHGIPYKDLCLTENKTAVGADLYVDDSMDNVRALREKGLEVIVFSNSTNLDGEPPRANDWAELEGMILEALQRWRDAPAAKQSPSGR